MSPRVVIFAVGSVLAALVIVLGLRTFNADDLLLNLTSEAVGVIIGGLVLFALVETFLSYRKQREWASVRDELFSRIYWEVETVQFSVRPIAMWHVGATLGEELRQLIETGPQDNPMRASYFLELTERLENPLQSLSSQVVPRVIALTDDRHLTRALLDPEEVSLKIRAVRHSLSETSPERPEFSALLNELLEKAATVADYLDGKRHRTDEHKAAQARFERLRGLPFATSWNSETRTVYEDDGRPYRT